MGKYLEVAFKVIAAAFIVHVVVEGVRYLAAPPAQLAQGYSGHTDRAAMSTMVDEAIKLQQRYKRLQLQTGRNAHDIERIQTEVAAAQSDQDARRAQIAALSAEIKRLEELLREQG